MFAAVHGKLTPEPAAPAQWLGQVIVGQVPAGVLHQSQRQPRVHRVLGVGARHRLVLSVGGCRGGDEGGRGLIVWRTR